MCIRDRIYRVYDGTRIALLQVAPLAMGLLSGNISDLNLKEGSILENAYRFTVTAHSLLPDAGCCSGYGRRNTLFQRSLQRHQRRLDHQLWLRRERLVHGADWLHN